MRLSVHVTPRAARESITVEADGALRVRVTAPPADGAANAAVSRLLSRALGIPPRDVVLVGGASSRQKMFDVPLDGPEVAQRVVEWGRTGH